MLRRNPPKPAVPDTAADVHAARHARSDLDSPTDVLLDLRNILQPTTQERT